MENYFKDLNATELLLHKELIKNDILIKAIKEVEEYEVNSQLDAFRIKNVLNAAMKEVNNV